MLTRLLNWFNGWRQDHEGWWVRARREHDPVDFIKANCGFLEEACVAISTPEHARTIDKMEARNHG